MIFLKNTKRLLAAFISLILLISMVGCGEQSEEKENYDVRVMLRQCEGIIIEGESVVDVAAGRNVTFKVGLKEGYVYIGNSAGADFDPEKSRLRIQNVFAPMTIDMIVVKEEDVIRLKIEKNSGSANVSADEILLAYAKDVTVSAEGTDTLKFDGWSVGGYIKDGGELLSESSTYTMHLDRSSTIFANFSGYTDYVITYNLNGGHVNDSSDTEYAVTAPYKETFAMQQTLESNGTFVRDGYVAVGYSSEPCDYSDHSSANDIPDFANMGGITRVDKGEKELYVVWAKETPASEFKYEKKKITYVSDSSYVWGNLDQKKKTVDGIEIKGYTGSSPYVVIPEEIEGLPVMQIASGAFGNSLERVVIPRTVKNIADGAFSDCEKLYEVVFFDSVVSVSDKSFASNIKTVVLNSQRLPVYSGEIEGSFCIKYERMRQAAVNGDKKIIIVAGSSSLNGINSPLMEELMPGYSVINYGTNVANPASFFLDVISKYVTEGDIVIHAPEYSSSSSMGSNDFHAKVFRGNEQCYDIFRDIDLSDYTSFWESFREFQIGDPNDSSLVPAIHQKGKEYQKAAEINKYGDRSTNRPNVRGNFGSATETFHPSKLQYEVLNKVNKKYEESGALLLMSFAPFDASRLAKSSSTPESYEKFTKACAEKLDYPVISNVGTYVMDHKKFFDSEWHLNDDGAAMRTRNLAEDLKAYLADPDSYK